MGHRKDLTLDILVKRVYDTDIKGVCSVVS